MSTPMIPPNEVGPPAQLGPDESPSPAPATAGAGTGDDGAATAASQESSVSDEEEVVNPGERRIPPALPHNPMNPLFIL